MRISDWSSDVCSSDLICILPERSAAAPGLITRPMRGVTSAGAPLPSTGILRNSFFREVQLGELVHWNVLLLGGNVADQVTLGTNGVNFERKSTRLKSSHSCASRMPSSACKNNTHQT